MKPFTLVFASKENAITIALEAHCQDCAFRACMGILEEKKPPNYEMLICHAVFEGLLTNLWPEMDDRYAKLLKNVHLHLPPRPEVN